MAYDEVLTQRFRDALGDAKGITEKRMMGGVCFLVNGNMIGGADRSKAGQGRFMFRVGKENATKAATFPGAEQMIQGGRKMSGFFFVDEKVCNEDVLRVWLDLAFQHANALPPKYPRQPGGQTIWRTQPTGALRRRRSSS